MHYFLTWYHLKIIKKSIKLKKVLYFNKEKEIYAYEACICRHICVEKKERKWFNKKIYTAYYLNELIFEANSQ